LHPLREASQCDFDGAYGQISKPYIVGYHHIFRTMSISVEQRVLIKSLRSEGHGSTQIYFKLIEHDGDKELSYPDVSY
jgi:hypothetical protein